MTRQLLRRARKRLKRSSLISEGRIKAAKDVERFNIPMKLMDEVLTLYGGCPLLNCTKHPNTKNYDTHSEVDASSCTDMDTSSIVDDQEQASRRRK
ncbi:hypothetical protein AVEN_173184-1 [Araneus ventricosus]|uniref:Uncharacterized protein n=1 Tax=Araneus ventricosus TaxID=182803 RepID=A0A4Y2RNK2_ARAVE|nr:hypothetical protein AVEN_173184-1 [Araneus ventricosus]